MSIAAWIERAEAMTPAERQRDAQRAFPAFYVDCVECGGKEPERLACYVCSGTGKITKGHAQLVEETS